MSERLKHIRLVETEHHYEFRVQFSGGGAMAQIDKESDNRTVAMDLMRFVNLLKRMAENERAQ